MRAEDDLSGKTVHARPSSTYHDSLVALSEQFKKAGKPPVNIIDVPDALEDEDMMEMLNLGMFEVILGNDPTACRTRLEPPTTSGSNIRARTRYSP